MNNQQVTDLNVYLYTQQEPQRLHAWYPKLGWWYSPV